MASVGLKMGLRLWNLLGDKYSHSQLAQNFAKLDLHDHSPGRGAQIGTGGLLDGAVTIEKLAPAAVQRTGLTGQGASIIPTEESRTGASYQLMPTHDEIPNVDVAPNGVIIVLFQARVKSVGGGVATASIFLDTTQVKIASSTTGVPSNGGIETGAGTNTNTYYALTSAPHGLAAVQDNTTNAAGDDPTGQIIGVVDPLRGAFGGACFIEAAAGTHTVSIRYRNPAGGDVYAKERKLRVLTMTF